jgi:hypothetical protein
MDIYIIIHIYIYMICVYIYTHNIYIHGCTYPMIKNI